MGKRLSAPAVQSMKRMTMELGGHAPVIVFGDADPEEVAASAVAAKFRSAGQICNSPTRFYVHESIHKRFVERFMEQARQWPVGNGLDENVRLGPLANAQRLVEMEVLTSDARSRGIEVAVGGERIGEKGYF